MVAQSKDLWRLALDQLFIDPAEFADALEHQVEQEPLDYRTRLLIRDGIDALRCQWGDKRLDAWLAVSPAREKIGRICREHFERSGFPFLRGQLMEPTKPETIRQLLHDIGSQLRRVISVAMGGSGALILKGLLVRRTQDIDFVNEVPKEVRELGEKLKEFERTHLLEVTHFQEHYLPSGWASRTQGLEPFGSLRVQLVDPYDVFLSKLSSIREKDRKDLKDVAPKLDKTVLVDRFRRTMQSVLASEELQKRCKDNWNMLYGEPLPS